MKKYDKEPKIAMIILIIPNIAQQSILITLIIDLYHVIRNDSSSSVNSSFNLARTNRKLNFISQSDGLILAARS